MVIRKVEILRAAWGAALLLAPERVLRDLHHVTIDPRSVIITRILGARHLTQAALSGVSPSPDVLAMGVWVDCAHAATALGLAAADRARARAGLTDTAIAAIFAGIGYRDLTTGRAATTSRPVKHDRRRDILARAVLGRLPAGPLLLRAAMTGDETP